MQPYRSTPTRRALRDCSYGTVATFVEAIGQEEKDADEKLTEVAAGVNAETIKRREEGAEEKGEEVGGAEEEETPASKKSASKIRQEEESIIEVTNRNRHRETLFSA